MTWTAENLPPELVEILDRDAGKVHSTGGSVRASLARILNAYDALRDRVLWEHVEVQQHIGEHMARMDAQKESG